MFYKLYVYSLINDPETLIHELQTYLSEMNQ